MTIQDNLQDLELKINLAKNKLCVNLTSKGVENITTANTLNELADSVSGITSSAPANLEEKTVTITTNGNHTITPSTSFDGMSKVSVSVNVPSGGGSITTTDWSEIGYDAQPSYIQNAFGFAKVILDNWDSQRTDYSTQWMNDKQLLYFPKVDVSKVENFIGTFKNSNLECLPSNLDFCNVVNFREAFANTNIKEVSINNIDYKCNDMSYMFDGCESLVTAGFSFNWNNVSDMSYMFQNCPKLENVNWLSTSSCRNMTNMFYNCTSLNELPELDSSLVENMDGLLYNCNQLKKINRLDFSSCYNMTNMFGESWQPTNFYEANFINLGQQENCQEIRIPSANWGDDNYGEFPNALQSLKDSLITNIYDRNVNGLSTLHIYLHSNVQPRLTEEEWREVGNKGYIVQFQS